MAKLKAVDSFLVRLAQSNGNNTPDTFSSKIVCSLGSDLFLTLKISAGSLNRIKTMNFLSGE